MEYFQSTLSLLEAIAMLFGIAGVWLTIRQNSWCFPVGMVNVGLYAYLFYDPAVSLLADALLQSIYLFLLAYGWYKWKNPSKQTEVLLPQRSSLTLKLRLFIIGITTAIVLGWFFDTYTRASLPWLDAGLTSTSLIAQWMIARKKIENWLLWIIADAVYIPMYLYKQLPLTAFLYGIFLLLAIKGWQAWKKEMNQNTTDETRAGV